MNLKKNSYLCLVKFQSQHSERVHIVEKSPFVIGRSQESDILYAHNSASRKHLEISFEQDKIQIKDLGSSNGTYVGNQRLDVNTNFLINNTTPVKIGVGEETLYFDVIMRPIELESHENREKLLRQSLSEVVKGLKNHARVEVEKEIHDEVLRRYETELLSYREEKRKRIDQEIAQLEEDKVARRKRIDSEITQYEEETRYRVQKARQDAEGLVEQYTKESNHRIQKREAEVAEQIANSLKQSADKIRLAEDESATKIRKAENELKERIERSEFESSQKIKKAEKESDEKISQALKEINLKLLNATKDATLKADEILAQADEKRMQVISAANQQRDTILSEAKALAEESAHNARKEYEQTLEKAKFDGQALIEKMAAEQGAKLEKERQESLVQLREQVTKEHEHIIKDYKIKIKALEEDHAKLNAETLHLQEILPPLRHESQTLKLSAQKEATELRESAKLFYDTTILEAKKEAEEIMRKQTEDHLRALAKERIEKLESLRKETEAEQEQIVNVYKEKISALQKDHDHLATEKKSLLESIPKLRTENSSLSLQNETLKTEYIKANTEFQKINDKLEKGQKLVAEAAAAKQELDQFYKTKKSLETEIEKLNEALDRTKKKNEEDLRKLKDDLLLKMETEKKKVNDDFNQYRNKQLAEFQTQLDLEQKRIVEIRKEQSTEIARLIQVTVADALPDYITDNDVIGNISKDVFEAAKDTLLNNESLLKPDVSHLDPMQIKKMQKKAQYYRWAGYATGSLALIGLLIYRQPILDYIKTQEQNSAGKQMMEKRRQASVFVPEQTDEYRKSYMENVLYMKHYADVKLSQEFQQRWTLRLNDMALIRQFKITEDDMIKFIAVESSMVKTLKEKMATIDAVYLEDSFEGMRKYEAEEIDRIAKILKSRENLEKIRAIEKEFITSYIKANLK